MTVDDLDRGDVASESTLDASDEPTIGAASGRRNPIGSLDRGDTVGRYVVVSRLGAGGMGVVYAAFDPELDRKVALKLLHAEDERRPGRRRGAERILREAQALARLNHPNVVTVHDLGEHEGHVFVAMEFVQGRTLREWLDERSRTWNEIVGVFCKAGAGLAAAHEKGLVHRDFKPDNVMIDDEHRVRVLDFGLARAVETTVSDEGEHCPSASSPSIAANVTRGGHLVGTPAYMAPEQHLQKPISAASDQFSFCVALWEALYRQRPFAGDSPVQLAVSVTEGTLRAPPNGTDVPKRFHSMLRRGLEVDPARRFASMRELIDALAYDPTRRRRQVLVAGAILATGGTLLGGWQVSQERVRASCRAEGEAITTVYDDAVEQRIRHAMLETGAAGAQTSFEKTVPWIERFVDAWKDARTQTCMAHHVEGTLDPELARRARECLDEQQVELEALLDRITGSGIEPLWATITAAVSLPLPTTCTDWASLSRLPDIDEGVRERVAAATRELVELEAGNGNEAGVQERGERLMAQAVALGYPPLVARAHLTAAHLAEEGGDYERAKQEGLQAFYVAGRSGADAMAARAATDLSRIVGKRGGQAEQGLVWAHVALMWLDRLHVADDDERRMVVLHHIGDLLVDTGDYAAAVAQLRKVVAIRERTLGPDHLRVAIALDLLGVALSESGDQAAAIEHYQRALAIWQHAAGDVNPHLASIFNNLGGLYYLRNDTQRALESYARALQIIENVRGPNHPDVASPLSNMALVHTRIGELELAQAELERALQVAEASLGPQHPTTAALLNHLAILLIQRESFEKALPLLQRSLRIVEDTEGPDHPDIAEVALSLGAVYVGLGDFERAIEFERRAIEITENARGPHHAKLIDALAQLATTFSRKGEESQEIATRQRALDLCRKSEIGASRCAEIRFDLGRALWKTGEDRQRALALVEQGRSELASVDPSDPALIEEIDAWLAQHRRLEPRTR